MLRKAFILWVRKHRYFHTITDWEGGRSFRRYCVLGYFDEWRDGKGKLHRPYKSPQKWMLWIWRKTNRKVWLGRLNLMPHWFPFNVFLHWWNPVRLEDEEWHDHPRWTISIPLRGEILEETPWGTNVMRPGEIIFRSHRYIHRFKMKPEHKGKTWTLFIVGRRVHPQNIYYDIRRQETPE